MTFNMRIVSTYPPRVCGIGEFSRNLATALEPFPEVGRTRVAAITKTPTDYAIPVDITIEQYDPQSWQRAATAILDRAQTDPYPNVVLLQHEYGLDGDGRERNYVEMARRLSREGLTTVVFLHTVLKSPDDHQKATLQGLAAYADGIVVTAKSATKILADVYGIDEHKIRHIDHGVRERDIPENDRLKTKRRYGLEKNFLLTTLGLLSPDKGIQFGIAAYAKFLGESCTERQRRHMTYLIAGNYHPDFVAAEGGKPYADYRKMLGQALEDSRLKCHVVKALDDADFEESDIVFLQTYLDEPLFRMLYGATNAMVLPYLNPGQISSGILADTIGSGRIPITTKTLHARELIGVDDCERSGLVLASGGILVDPQEPSVDQTAQGIDYLVFNAKERLCMERDARERGHEMTWNNTGWKLIHYIDFLNGSKQIRTGRGPKFERGKDSIYREMNELLKI